MDPNEAIRLATIALSATLALIAKIKATHGLTDEQVMSAAQAENDSTRTAIAGYLAGIPS